MNANANSTSLIVDLAIRETGPTTTTVMMGMTTVTTMSTSTSSALFVSGKRCDATTIRMMRRTGGARGGLIAIAMPTSAASVCARRGVGATTILGGQRREVSVSASSSGASSSSVNGGGPKPPAVSFDGEKVKKWFDDVTEKPWDTPAVGAREFLAVKPIAAVVEMDNATETMSANEIESHGLNLPTCQAEALARAKANSVRFRQNYLQIAAVVVLMGSECFAFALSLISFYVYLAFSSDSILGELSLATKDALKWNDKVVAGLPRATVKKATLGVSVVLFLLSDATANTYAVLRSLAWATLIAAAHAVTRPIDLKGTLGDIVKGFRSAKSKEELQDAAKEGFKSVQTWWKNRKPSEPTPVILVQKNGGAKPNGAKNDEPAPRRENSDGAIDVDAREARDRKQLP